MNSTVTQMDMQLFCKNFLSQGLRPDGRDFRNSRATTVNVKSLRQADGSAIVKIGKTTVLCGIKAELAKPKAECPNEGVIIVNIDLSPLCSPMCPPGPPSDDAQTATTFLSTALRDLNAVDLKTLCIVPDKLAWVLYLDVICLNLDGGLLEAIVCASTFALLNTTLPTVHYNVETGVKSVDNNTKIGLKLNATPFATTFAVFDEHILQDPTAKEESLATGVVTVIVCTEKGSGMSQPVYLPGCRPLTPQELVKCVASAEQRAKQLFKLLPITNDSPER